MSGDIGKTGGVDSPELDPIDLLRDHCLAFVAEMPGDPGAHGIIMARSKLDEFVFWLRSAERASRLRLR